MRNFLAFCLLASVLCSCQKLPSLGAGDADHLATASQDDCGFVQNSYGERVSWKSQIPIRLYLDQTVTAEYEQVLRTAAAKWEDAAGKTLFQIYSPTGSLGSASTQNNKNEVFIVSSWTQAQSLEALTNLYWAGNQATEADLNVDAQYFQFYIDTTTDPTQIHLESLLLHELGHVLGLKHRSTVPSVMWAVLSPDVVRNVLTDADKQSIKCEY